MSKKRKQIKPGDIHNTQNKHLWSVTLRTTDNLESDWSLLVIGTDIQAAIGLALEWAEIGKETRHYHSAAKAELLGDFVVSDDPRALSGNLVHHLVDMLGNTCDKTE